MLGFYHSKHNPWCWWMSHMARGFLARRLHWQHEMGFTTETKAWNPRSDISPPPLWTTADTSHANPYMHGFLNIYFCNCIHSTYCLIKHEPHLSRCQCAILCYQKQKATHILTGCGSKSIIFRIFYKGCKVATKWITKEQEILHHWGQSWEGAWVNRWWI